MEKTRQNSAASVKRYIMTYLILSIAFFVFGFSMLVAQAIFGWVPVDMDAYFSVLLVTILSFFGSILAYTQTRGDK